MLDPKYFGPPIAGSGAATITIATLAHLPPNPAWWTVTLSAGAAIAAVACITATVVAFGPRKFAERDLH
jgi:hypothetical protein